MSAAAPDNLDAEKTAVSLAVAHYNTTAPAQAAAVAESDEHELATTTFHSTTRCHLCCDIIWGVVNQGVECTRCHLILHHRCRGQLAKIDHRCGGGLQRLLSAPCVAQHALVSETFVTEVACSGCGVRVGGLSVHRCQLCRLAVHDRAACKDALRRVICRPWACLGAPLPHAVHHWTAAVCSGTCVVCRVHAASVGVHLVLHCALCSAVVHTKCRDALGDGSVCSLGAVAGVVLSPHTVAPLPEPDADGRRFRAHAGALLVFVNRKSGGGQGAALYTLLLRAGLSPLQVHDLADGGPAEGLRLLARAPGTRVLVCGGDGTAGWLLSELDKLWPNEEQHQHHHHHHHHHHHDDPDDELEDALDEDDADDGATGKKKTKKKVRVKRSDKAAAAPAAAAPAGALPRPPLAMLPIGTGNDLARITGWGGGYDGEPVGPWLQALEKAEVRMFDRWSVAIAPAEGDLSAAPLAFGASERKHTMNNYLSVGMDAAIALRFHRRREANPQLFTSRAVNKAWYGMIGAREQVTNWPTGTKLLKRLIRVLADGVELDLGENQALVVLNVQSYSGGVDLWNDFGTAAVDDGKLEIVGFSGPAHAAFVRGKLAAVNKLCQAAHVRIEWLTKHELPTQVDGEPWSQAPAAIDVRFWNQAPVLVRHGDSIANRAFRNKAPQK